MPITQDRFIEVITEAVTLKAQRDDLIAQVRQAIAAQRAMPEPEPQFLAELDALISSFTTFVPIKTLLEQDFFYRSARLNAKAKRQMKALRERRKAGEAALTEPRLPPKPSPTALPPSPFSLPRDLTGGAEGQAAFNLALEDDPALRAEYAREMQGEIRNLTASADQDWTIGPLGEGPAPLSGASVGTPPGTGTTPPDPDIPPVGTGPGARRTVP